MNEHTRTNVEIQPFCTAANLTMSDLIRLATADLDLASKRKRDVASALRSVCRHAGLDPALTPASHAYFRKLFTNAHHAPWGVSAKTVQNLQTQVDFALRRYIVPDRRSGRKGLSPAWQALWDKLTDPEMKFGMSRLLRYCSDEGIRPEDVSVVHAEAFHDYLRTQTLVEQPEALHRRSLVQWNKAAGSIEGWPGRRLSVPSNRDTYAMQWDELPAGLRLDAEKWLKNRADPDPFDPLAPPNPARPDTIKALAFSIRQLVSGLKERGYDISRLQSLADLVAPNTAREALRFFFERAGGKSSSQVSRLASVLLGIARHWCRSNEADVRELKSVAGRLAYRQNGLTPKNRERLRQFTDSRNIESLLMLPQRIYDNVRRKNEISIGAALDMQVAVALELLLMMPIRRKNLVTLMFGPGGHLHLRRDRKDATHVVIRDVEVKNSIALEYPIPQESADLLEIYLNRFRPTVVRSASYYVFPGDNPGCHKALDQFSRQFSKTIWRMTGLRVNVHLLRHVGAKVYLDRNPGAYEVVRRVLAHKSLSTTVNNYVGLEVDGAVRHFNAVILGIRDSIRRDLRDV
jgi:integrase